MAEIHWTEVDQVTTVWTDGPLPLRAGLVFRTGRVDETLSTGGKTHLIEHLVMAAVSDPHQQQHNGLVGGAFTGFFTLGNPQDVASFLEGICEALSSLPGDKLEGHVQVLEAEQAARRYNLSSNMLAWRYGAAGYGLLGLPEFGLKRTTLEQLRDYAAQSFTRENAVLWLSGPVLGDLQLRLPSGSRRPIPPLKQARYTFPSWYVDDECGGVAVGLVVPRVRVATIFCEIASRRLSTRLRIDQSLSYAPTVDYAPLNADTAHLVLYADSEEKNRAELARAFSEVFEGFKEVDEPEIEAVRGQVTEKLTGSLALPAADQKSIEVQRAAMDWILGRAYEPIEKIETDLLSVTAEDVAGFVRDVQSTAIFALPSRVHLLPSFGNRVPLSHAAVVQGRKALKIDAPFDRQELVYGKDGVSLLFEDGSHGTVLFSRLAAVLKFGDGGLVLIGNDALHIDVEPTLWRDGVKIRNHILAQVPGKLVIDLDARPRQYIPQPQTTIWQRLLAVSGFMEYLPYLVAAIIFTLLVIFLLRSG